MALALLGLALLMAQESGTATHYGASYNGQSMGCRPYTPYSSYDASIVAVRPSRLMEWPCGTALEISGPAGTLIATVQDSCPGCVPSKVDLSEAGFELVCGPLSRGVCNVTIRRVD